MDDPVNSRKLINTVFDIYNIIFYQVVKKLWRLWVNICLKVSYFHRYISISKVADSVGIDSTNIILGSNIPICFCCKGLSINDVRSQGGCPARTFCGQAERGFFRCGRPHFLVQKT